MAITQTDICNLAVARVGSELLTDVVADAASGVKAAQACLNAFDQVLKEVARAGRWNCLKTRATLDQLQDAPTFAPKPEFGWDFSYYLPMNCVRLIQLNGTFIETEARSQFFEIEGRLLLTNASFAQVQYIACKDCYDEWDPFLLDCVAVLLASKIAFALRQDGGVSDALRQEYERITLPRARSRNGNEIHERTMDPARTSSFVAARWRSTRR